MRRMIQLVFIIAGNLHERILDISCVVCKVLYSVLFLVVLVDSI
jgi:hypothetical protein